MPLPTSPITALILPRPNNNSTAKAISANPGNPIEFNTPLPFPRPFKAPRLWRRFMTARSIRAPVRRNDMFQHRTIGCEFCVAGRKPPCAQHEGHDAHVILLGQAARQMFRHRARDEVIVTRRRRLVPEDGEHRRPVTRGTVGGEIAPAKVGLRGSVPRGRSAAWLTSLRIGRAILRAQAIAKAQTMRAGSWSGMQGCFVEFGRGAVLPSSLAYASASPAPQ